MLELGHPDAISRLINSNLKKVFQETTFEVAFPGPWGLRLFQCRMAPEMKADGSFDYVICFSRDITKERQAERRVVDSEKAEAANQLHQQIAHEINNPLQALRNTIYHMKHDSLEELPVHVDRADELLGRVETLLRRMLTDSDEPAPESAG